MKPVENAADPRCRLVVGRRTLLGLAGVGGAIGLLGLSGATTRAAASGDAYVTLRGRWSDLLTGGEFDPDDPLYAAAVQQLNSAATSAYTALDTAEDRTALWPDLPVGTSQPTANITNSFGRLRAIALAHASPGGVYRGNATVAAAVVAALDWLNTTVYGPVTPAEAYGNSWDWVIGVPQAYGAIACLLGEALPVATIDAFHTAVSHFIPDPAAPVPARLPNVGANRSDIVLGTVLDAVVSRDGARIAAGSAALAPVLEYVTTGDGFYRDGSFIQHTTVPYVGSYGVVLIGGIAKLAALLADTDWAIESARLTMMFDAVTDALAPFIYNGVLMAGVSGRAVSRSSTDEHKAAQGAMVDILTLAQAADATRSAQLREMVKGWIERDDFSDYLSSGAVGIRGRQLGRTLLADQSIRAQPEPVEHRIFPVQDRSVHRRPGWAFAISMCSSRISYYENGNGENLRGWHTNSGMTYWWPDDKQLGQYDDGYWPTVDPYRLPGTTVSTKHLADGAGGQWGAATPAADVTWVGGATDGEFAAVGQHVTGLESTLDGRKSWFCLADTIVCLGAGIAASDGTTVETVVDNRKLDDPRNQFLLNGVPSLPQGGDAVHHRKASWTHLAGHGGYVFPDAAYLNAERAPRAGRWTDIRTGDANTELIERTYLTQWFDHGVNPTDGSYHYLLMPGASAHQTLSRAVKRHWARVLSNTTNAQVVAVDSLGVVAANFWAAGQAGPIQVDRPCSVLIRRSGDRATICVADPTWTNDTVTVTFRHRSRTFDLTSARGRTRTALVDLG